MPPVYVPREPREKPPKVAVEPVFTPYEWAADPTVAEFRRLADHLRMLDGIGSELPVVVSEIARLSTKVSGWIVVIEEGIEDAKAIQYTEAVRRGEKWLTSITAAKEALMDQDLPRAIGDLEEVVE